MAGAVHCAPVFAQSTQQAATDDSQTDSTSSEGQEIVVTGRAGNDERKKVDTSYAISTITQQDLQMRAPIGLANALKQVPGFYVTSTSGEISNGLRVRGIPSDGYQTVALLEDGIPIQADPGLGWLNGDQSLRLDQTVERIEVVRGGPSSIFYSNAPGAAINFITRRGTDHVEGELRYEGANYNSHRLDGWLSGPIGSSDWRFLAGGYYRLSDGQHHVGYKLDKGGQFRVNVSRDFDHGSVMFGVKRIDEKVGNWRGGVYTTDADGDVVSVPGFDDRRDAIAGPDTRYFDFLTPDGPYRFDASTNATVRLTQLTFDANYDLSDRFKVEERARYRTSWTRRNEVTLYNVAKASDLLTSLYGNAVNADAGQSLGLFYRNTGTEFGYANQNGNGLALVDLARSHTVPLDEFITDTRVTGNLDALGHHDLALGFYFANVNEEYNVNSAAILTDVTDNASVLDAYLLDAEGNKIYQFTDNGVAQYGAEFANSSGESDTIAVYASDEWQLTPKLRLDAGIRWEQIRTTGQVEGRETVDLDQSPTAADDSVAVGNGIFTPFSRKFDHTSWTVGANYQFQPDWGLFLRYTDAFRLPSISSFITNAGADPVVQTMNFLEGGIKFSRPTFDFYLTGFRSIYNSYEIDDYREEADGTLEPFRVFGDTRTWGTELEATWRPVDWFDLHGSWTWQDARFSSFVFTNSDGVLTDYSHHKLNGVPANIFRLTPGFNLFDRKLRLQADVNYNGDLYTDVANDIRLPSYWTLDIDASYNVTPRLQLNLIVENVTNTFGLVNGNPRAGTIDNSEAGQAIFIGSSLAARSFRGAITYRF
ncbi:TonB-dependent receptor [Stakelama saccharophila]|uniref:TonB-dependent receptor n=1 Tax=Stakelama saccharophila TaxID=3075605 RepID=A0ABZ0B8Z3_9SPHN|nr:TonB-dependent receptor [Stakelama sp. W311]WNO53864.1 TonB-dependent receptor [Stakelama sp. W311]